MSEHVVKNNPMREFMFALGGVGLFLSIVLLIGISAWFRPAGVHIKVQTTEELAAAEAAEATAAESVTPATATATTAAPVEDAVATAEADTATPADATATPAPSAADATVAAESVAAAPAVQAEGDTTDKAATDKAETAQ